MQYQKPFLFLIFFLHSCIFSQAQKKVTIDSSGQISGTKNISAINDNAAKKYKPGVAIRRSAILPGWGQYTNKKYWKIPIVYGALGTTTYFFFRNLKQYKESKNAYTLATDNDVSNDEQIKQPYYSVRSQPDRIKTFRNQVRQNVDYSVLFFVIFWGLNVADAAVDAHLKTFDVSDDLSISIKPVLNPIAHYGGLSFVLGAKDLSKRDSNKKLQNLYF